MVARWARRLSAHSLTISCSLSRSLSLSYDGRPEEVAAESADGSESDPIVEGGSKSS
jgi:hypothetical protein